MGKVCTNVQRQIFTKSYYRAYHVKSPPIGQKSELNKGGGTSSATSDLRENVPKISNFPMILVKIRDFLAIKGGGGLRARQATLNQIGLKRGTT